MALYASDGMFFKLKVMVSFLSQLIKDVANRGGPGRNQDEQVETTTSAPITKKAL